MAEQQQQQQQDEREFTFKRVVLAKNETLGNGSYGAVCKAMCDELPCAAKLLFPILFDLHKSQPSQNTAAQAREHRQPYMRFEQECHFLSQIKHPHIVQYLGTYRDPDTRAPVLLMELMDESLTHFLERSNGLILLHVKIDTLYGVSLALAYLHSNDIVHRDLSSNNVLLIAGCHAKVTDFGMSQLADAGSPYLSSLTLCPGTPTYMPPEALNEPPVYTDKLDCFSFGVLTIQVLTRQFPEPTDRFRMMQFNDRRFPSGIIQARVDVPEVERRQAHISMVDPHDPLLPVALDCLKDKDHERPSARDICSRFLTLKKSHNYMESVQQSQDKDLIALNRKIRARDNSIREKAQQLRVNQQQLSEKDQQLAYKNQQLNESVQQSLDKDNLLQKYGHVITEQERQLHLNQQQLTEKDQQLTEKDLQLTEQLLLHQDQVQQLTRDLQQANLEIREKENSIREKERQLDRQIQSAAQIELRNLEKDAHIQYLQNRLERLEVNKSQQTAVNKR